MKHFLRRHSNCSLGIGFLNRRVAKNGAAKMTTLRRWWNWRESGSLHLYSSDHPFGMCTSMLLVRAFCRIAVLTLGSKIFLRKSITNWQSHPSEHRRGVGQPCSRGHRPYSAIHPWLPSLWSRWAPLYPEDSRSSLVKLRMGLRWLASCDLHRQKGIMQWSQ